MTPGDRDLIIDKMAGEDSNDLSFEDLLQFFYNARYEHYDSLTDEELLDYKAKRDKLRK